MEKEIAEFTEENKNNKSFQGRMGFLTIPKSGDLTKVQVASTLDKKNVPHYYIVQETHKDGDKHFHAIISTDVNKNFNLKLNALNFEGHHANIQRVRNAERALAYLQKEDKEPLIKGKIVEFCEKKESHKAKITIEDAKKFKTFREVIESEAGSQMSLINGKRLQEGYQIVHSMLEIFEKPGPILWDLQGILFKFRMEEKKRHFWVQGVPNTGKTYFAEQLVRDRGAKRMQIYNQFYGAWHPNAYLYIIDDVNSLEWEKVKEITNAKYGSMMNVKGSFVMNEQEKILIIFSNESPKESMKLTAEKEVVFNVRFEVVNATKLYQETDLKKRTVWYLEEDQIKKYKENNNYIELD